LFYGIFCGGVTGVAIFLFRLAANKAEVISRELYSIAKSSTLYILAAFAILAAVALLMMLLHKKVPESKGGGIPRSEGVLRGVLPFKWLRTLIGTIIGSMLSFLCGVPVGSEGPSVLIGTSIGEMCLGNSKNKTAWSRYVMTGGAGAGFAIATGAPLSGILFALEEIHKRFTPMIVMTVSVSVVSATYINRVLCELFSISPMLFDIGLFSGFKLSHVLYLFILGIAVAFSVALYDISVELLNRFTSRFRKHFATYAKLVIVLILSGILCLVFPDAAYNGHHLIIKMLESSPGIGFLIAVLTIRFIMMVFVTASGVTGGSFVPTLAIGAVFSTIIARFLVLVGMPEDLSIAIILLGMCGFIGGTLRAPLTAAVLFIELTGQFTDVLYVALVIFTVNSITELFHLTPFYERSIETMTHEQNGDKKPIIAHFETTIMPNAFVIGKSVRDVMWPSSTVVISVKRANDQMDDTVNDGEKKLYAGDTVILRSKYYDEVELCQIIRGLVGNEAMIHKIEV